MRVLIVHAHAEPQSFNGALAHEATAALTGTGHEVVVSDLYAMGFDPVSDRRNFVTVKDPRFFKQQAEEAHASEHNGDTSRHSSLHGLHGDRAVRGVWTNAHQSRRT